MSRIALALCLVMLIRSGAVMLADDADPPVDGILISVSDATSKKAVPQFRVIAGVKSAGVSDEFEKRTGKEVVSWQQHTIREGRDGTLIWPLAKAYDTMALRVEADGFIPETSAWIKKSEGALRVVIKLREDPGVIGRILQPDGKPAVKATLAIALPQRDAVLDDGRLRSAGQPLPEKLNDRWSRPVLVESDVAGEYRVPTETDSAAAVLIVHDSGVAEMPYAKFADMRNITLRSWGRIEGQVLWSDKPGIEEPVSLSIHRDEYGYPGTIAQNGNTKTDTEGRFVFDKVLPGHAQVSRGITVEQIGTAPPSSWNFPGLFAHIDVRSSGPTRMLIGGQGRKVTGRLTGRETWGDITFHFHPTAPRVGSFGGDNGWQAFGQFRSSPFGPLFFRDKLQPNADGTFDIPHILPGSYQLFVSEAGTKQYVAAHRMEIEQETPGVQPAAVNLGNIRLKPR